jgi:hypothetical protein
MHGEQKRQETKVGHEQLSQVTLTNILLFQRTVMHRSQPIFGQSALSQSLGIEFRGKRSMMKVLSGR